MNPNSARCPSWLANRILDLGGIISFRDYMNIALNDPEHGSYGSGKLKIGKRGDFVTSSSLGPEFAELVAIQISDWLFALIKKTSNESILSIVEFGSGEGHFAYDLINCLKILCPELIERLQLIIIETNEGMIRRQKQFLNRVNDFKIIWCTLNDLQSSPVKGVIIANEVLDAFPFERLVYCKNTLYRQGVEIIEDDLNYKIQYSLLPLSNEINDSLLETNNTIGLKMPPDGVDQGWSTEWHVEVKPWLANAFSSLELGNMLIIDYALTLSRYYSKSRYSGTALAYKNQSAITNLISDGGLVDITSHLCVELIEYQAKLCGWTCIGNTSQGEALLSLGLSQKIHSLRDLKENELNIAIAKRESLLALVDPLGLGQFRWFAFSSDNKNQTNYLRKTSCKFLEEPII